MVSSHKIAPIDLTLKILHDPEYSKMQWLIFSASQKSKYTFDFVDMNVLVLPYAFLKDRCILPQMVEGLFPVFDLATGRTIENPFKGFTTVSMGQLLTLKERENEASLSF